MRNCLSEHFKVFCCLQLIYNEIRYYCMFANDQVRFKNIYLITQIIYSKRNLGEIKKLKYNFSFEGGNYLKCMKKQIFRINSFLVYY